MRGLMKYILIDEKPIFNKFSILFLLEKNSNSKISL